MFNKKTSYLSLTVFLILISQQAFSAKTSNLSIGDLTDKNMTLDDVIYKAYLKFDGFYLTGLDTKNMGTGIYSTPDYNYLYNDTSSGIGFIDKLTEERQKDCEDKRSSSFYDCGTIRIGYKSKSQERFYNREACLKMVFSFCLTKIKKSSS